MSTEDIVSVSARDGTKSELRVFRAPTSATEETVFISPAMGVPARYYDPFARALVGEGLSVVVADHRGTGSSSVSAKRGVDFGYVDMLERDWPVQLAAAREATKPSRLTVLGHSLGGQLAALYLALEPSAFDRLVTIASCSVDFRGWPVPTRFRILAATQTVGFIGRTLGFFPGERLGFGGRQPRGVVRDWSHNARTGRYEPHRAPIDFERTLRTVSIDALMISIEGDHLAPPGAVDLLARKLPRARLVREHLPTSWKVDKKNDPHFRWAREPGALPGRVADYLRER